MVRYMASRPDLVAIASMTPQHINNLAHHALGKKETLYQDLKQGTLTLPEHKRYVDELPEFTRAEDRADRFMFAAKAGDKKAAMKVLFPSLKYFGTWMGGNMSYGMDSLNDTFGHKDIFEMPSSASEGLFLIPHRLNEPGGIAAINSHFLEYIPEQDIDNDQPVTLMVHQLEVGQRYYQLLTSSGGLYRYNMEDLYEVTGFWGKTPVLRFISKRARQVSISNDRVNESDVVEAMNQCKHLFKKLPEHFILMPNKKGYYDLIVDSGSGR